MTSLYRAGNWQTSLVHDTISGNLRCEAEVSGRGSQMFSIVAYQKAGLKGFFFDTSWSLRERNVELRVDIDYEAWRIAGRAKEISVAFNVPSDDSGIRFLRQLSRGNAIALYTMEEERLAVFPLKGSEGAIRSLMTCWARISDEPSSQPRSDPFAPAVGETDPF